MSESGFVSEYWTHSYDSTVPTLLFTLAFIKQASARMQQPGGADEKQPAAFHCHNLNNELCDFLFMDLSFSL